MQNHKLRPNIPWKRQEKKEEKTHVKQKQQQMAQLHIQLDNYSESRTIYRKRELKPKNFFKKKFHSKWSTKDFSKNFPNGGAHLLAKSEFKWRKQRLSRKQGANMRQLFKRQNLKTKKPKRSNKQPCRSKHIAIVEENISITNKKQTQNSKNEMRFLTSSVRSDRISSFSLPLSLFLSPYLSL